jgi:PPE-repeat protein
MPSTVTKTRTITDVGNSGDLNQLADVAQKVGLGNVLGIKKVTFAALASAAAQDITTIAAGVAAGLTGQATLPPIGSPVAVRVTAGAAAAGLRQVGDIGATLSATVCRLSDDGKTLTFEAAVTGFVLLYVPGSLVPLSNKFA